MFGTVGDGPECIFELPRTRTGKLDRHTLETRVTSDLASC
jgi:acyl-coenzyme A synthetase/AMP-(fatty) acid ligase